ncbi:MAG: penicillin acylase family protein [Bacteroidota bacterium]
MIRSMNHLLLSCLFLVPTHSWAQSTEVIAKQVEIRRTEYGVPHILAANLKAAAFGLAWCELEDYGARVVRPLISARGDLAMIEGESAVDQDLINQMGYDLAIQSYPLIDQDTRDLMEGFAMGINHYLEKHPDRIPAYKDWRFSGYDIAALTANVYIGPQGQGVTKMLQAQKKRRDSIRQARGEGSNSWAFAPSRTTSGNAILVRNPHLNWTAGYYEAHLKVPGKLNFYGDFRIGGVFAIIGGFNERLGWSTTNNNPDLDEFYALKADPEQADHFLIDGISIPLERRLVQVNFKNGDAQALATRELLFTPYGPVIHRDEGKIYIFKSAGDRGFRRGEQYTRMLLAKNLEEWKTAMRMQAITQSNYMYADADGNIFYVWNAAIPDLPIASGGDTTAVEVDSSHQIWSHYIPFDDLPQLLNPQGGYLHNENDPFHFTNLNEVLRPEDFPDYFPKPRLRQRSQHSLKLIHNTDQLSLEEVVKRKHSMGMYLADQLKPDLIAALKKQKKSKDIKAAIQHLSQWDNTVSADSRGGLLFQEWMRLYNRALAGASPFVVDWSFDDPMNTPSGLSSPELAAKVMPDAMSNLTEKYGTWDLAWGDIHRLRRGEVDLPIGGGPGGMGCFRVLWFSDTKDNKRQIRGGDGWQLAVEFSDPPRAYSILAYGQSNDPKSPHYTDQTQLFADNKMKRVAFTESDIKAQLLRTYKPE